VDSTVAATLIHRAIGDRLTCIFVDNGLLRLDEANQVVTRYKKLRLPSSSWTRPDLFLDRLEGVTDPEQKRKIIGAPSSTSSREGHELGDFDFLAQGTLYPDVIESVSVRGPSPRHQEPPQRGRAARAHAFTLVEPLRELFKDEVRPRRRGSGHRQGVPGAPAVPRPRARRADPRRR
jgi:GMP synthase (glutamine-hydrolysing)